MYWKGVCLSLKGEFYEAIEHFDKVIQLCPKNGYAWFDKAFTLVKIEKGKEIIQCLRMATKLNPELRNNLPDEITGLLLRGCPQKTVFVSSRNIK